MAVALGHLLFPNGSRGRAAEWRIGMEAISKHMRILITNLTLASRSGTEVYVRDLALSLLRRGHDPVVYTTMPGTVAEELRSCGVAVVGDLSRIAPAPDVIHGHHTIETLTAMLHFPATPALFVCHSWIAWFDAPPDHRHVHAFGAVSVACRDRLVHQHGIPEDRVRLILNAVDLERFRPRGPLPFRPRRAVVFSSSAHNGAYLQAVQEACDRSGLKLEFIGAGMQGRGEVTERPERELGTYDLVFAKGKCALEAMAVGTAVVVCDAVGLGKMVTTGNLERLRVLNFGFSAMDREVTADAIIREIDGYDSQDAAAVSRLVRASACLEDQVDTLLAVYDEVIAAHAQCTRQPEDGESAAAALLRTLSGKVWESEGLSTRLAAERDVAVADQTRLGHVNAELMAENDRLAAMTAVLDPQVRELTAAVARLGAELDCRERALLELRGTSTFRLRARLLRIPGVSSAIRTVRARASSERG